MKPINKPKMIKRILPPLSRFPTIRGQWQPSHNGQIRAWYTPQQYEQCKKIFEIIKDAQPVRE